MICNTNIKNDKFIYNILSIYLFYREVKGTTTEAEDGATNQNVYVFYMERITSISLRTASSVNETMIMAVDKIEASARADFEDALLQLGKDNGKTFK